MGTGQQATSSFEQVVATVCGECLVGCGIRFFMRNGKIVDMAGDEKHPINQGSVCPRGAKIMTDSYQNHELAQYPAIRASFGAPFVQTTWQEATGFIADRLNDIRNEFGSSALTILALNPHNFGNQFLGLRFARLFGTPKVANYRPMKPAEVAAACMLGGAKGALTNPPPDWVNSKTILVLGSEIVSEAILMDYLLKAKDLGARLVCVDTKVTPLMSKADMPLVINPHTFTVLLGGIISLIIQEGLYEREFINRWTEGFSELAKASMIYASDRVGEICGLRPEMISKLAHLLAENRPLQIIGAVRREQVENSAELSSLAREAVTLLTLTNSIGVKGGGWNWLGTGMPSLTCGRDIANEVMFPCPEKSVHAFLEGELRADYRVLLQEIIEEKETCQALIWDGTLEDEIMAEDLVRALGRLKLVVHLSDKNNDIARQHAHVSLPVTSWLEEESLVLTSHHRAIQWRPKVIAPLGQRRPAGSFWIELAHKMGYGKWFPWKNNETLLDPVRVANFYLSQQYSLSGISSAMLRIQNDNVGGILWPCITKEDAKCEHGAPIKGKWILYRDGEKYPGEEQRFPTASGKIEVASDLCEHLGWGRIPFSALQPRHSGGADAHPFCLVLCSVPGFLEAHAVGYIGSQENNTSSRFVVGIHPRVAELLQIKDGTEVMLEKKGEEVLQATAWVTDKVGITCICLIDQTEPSYYSRFSYYGSWKEGTPVRLYKRDSNGEEANIALSGLFSPNIIR